jgi:hypothetical protein
MSERRPRDSGKKNILQTQFFCQTQVSAFFFFTLNPPSQVS